MRFYHATDDMLCGIYLLLLLLLLEVNNSLSVYMKEYK